jgi:hypothetical protein
VCRIPLRVPFGEEYDLRRRPTLVNTLNAAFSTLETRRRYEVWFLRLALADGSGAWWFRYLLMNPGRQGCRGDSSMAPVQLWATWFPRGGRPQSFIERFPLTDFRLSGKGGIPFYFRIGEQQVEENSCRGNLTAEGHRVSWDLRYHSTFGTTLSSKGWIGFSRTPHSDATFSGRIRLDKQTFEGDPLGFGLQGHNCGYRHRNFWTWTHAYFQPEVEGPSTLEALVYEMPLGLVFRKAVLWHKGQDYVLRKMHDISKTKNPFRWSFRGNAQNGMELEAEIVGPPLSLHRLPYLKTNCSGTFEVLNNSLADATVRLTRPGAPQEILQTTGGAVLEMVGD